MFINRWYHLSIGFGVVLVELGEDKILAHDIKCGDAKYFQGKEADIVMISMVAAGKLQAQTGRMYEQRYNVAASRARDRLYVFRSFERNAISENDLRARLLDHLSNPCIQNSEEIKELRDLCESDFERDVFDELSGRGYRIRPQVHVGNYRIDLVVEGRDDARLAIELDGDKYHGIERWLEDISRQRTLERMGWVFWRCWGSNYISNKEDCLNDLMAKLDSLKIEPIGSASAFTADVADQRTVSAAGVLIEDQAIELEPVEEEADKEPEQLQATGVLAPEPLAGKIMTQVEQGGAQNNGNGLETEHYVQINDTVTYAYLDNLNDIKMVQVVRKKESVADGIILHTSPIAQTLLGAFVGETITAHLPTGARNLKILEVVKS